MSQATERKGGDSCAPICSTLSALAEQTKLEIRQECVPQVDALIAAGWKFELPEIVNSKEGEYRMETEPWQWYWRAPAKRARSAGRKYLSTNQAYMALQRILSNNALSNSHEK